MVVEFKKKVEKFTNLMNEISKDIITIYKEHKEDIYHDSVLKMIKALVESQEVVGKAYVIHLNREIEDN